MLAMDSSIVGRRTSTRCKPIGRSRAAAGFCITSGRLPSPLGQTVESGEGFTDCHAVVVLFGLRRD
jgi:hypothetical protein